MDSDSKILVIQKSNNQSKQQSELSLMPEGLQSALPLQDFADLASFLESLKESDPAKP